MDHVADSLLHRVLDTCARDLATSLRRVDSRDPVIGEPVREHSRIVEAEYVNVRAMNEVVGQDARISGPEPRTDNADIRRVETHQLFNESESNPLAFVMHETNLASL